MLYMLFNNFSLAALYGTHVIFTFLPPIPSTKNVQNTNFLASAIEFLSENLSSSIL